MNLKFIYKICTKVELQKLKDKGHFIGSKKDLEDGFIHCSGEEQIEGTLKKYYLNQKDLILLKIDALKLDHLIWEQASDGNMFPHLYSSLYLNDIVNEFEISLSDDGSHMLPDNFKGDTLSETPKEFPYN